MPEAVIVAATRSPIGRAYKGSLKDLRPDDLAARIVRAALEQVPQLDPGRLDDLMLGCGVPGGEQGFNMARVVAVLLGRDDLPGTTLTRYCASSLQTTRMAFHAIRAGGSTGTTRARTGPCQTCTSPWARPPRTSPSCAASPARTRTSSARCRRTGPRKPSPRASSSARSPPSRCRTAGSSAPTTGPGPGRPLRSSPG